MDLSEFHDVFFEECFEGLDVMESGLLNLDHGTDVEEINAIFRAAHSIKGGGASFGFMDISNFTHVMETLLDEMRDARRAVTRDAVDLLLESVDVLRNMVNAAKDEDECDLERTQTVQGKLEKMLAQECTGDAEASSESESNNTETEAAADAPAGEGQNTWTISFVPAIDTLKSGTEPTRIFEELAKLGELEVVCDSSELPELKAIEPESSYLRWSVKLTTAASEDDIRELFAWVSDDSKLEITLANEDDNSATEAEIQAANDTEESSQEESTSAEQPTVEETKAADASSEEPKNQESAPSSDAKAPAKSEAPKKASGGSGGSGQKSSSSIRVSIDKVDELINMVGELVITQSMLSQIGDNFAEGNQKVIEKLRSGIAQLERNSRELQQSVLQIRMLPVSFSFSRFPRLVRDLSSSMGKKIELKMVGEHTEVDKTVLEKIGDPLVHLVRNSLDHGIELPEVRKAAGKPEVGTLELSAYHEGGDIVIQVIDDGAGLDKNKILSKAIEKGIVNEGEDLPDERIYNLIFAPGFSTADKVSDVSGRGVGMDVVRRNVRDLGGNVSIATNEGAGSTVTIRLPLTLAILDGQLVCVDDETYIISLVSIVESRQIKTNDISRVSGTSELYRLRDEYIPIVRVSNVFGNSDDRKELSEGLLVVVESDGKRYGLFVDELQGQQQVVIKSLETNFRQVQGISGATILGDGTVALIIDVPGLIQRHFNNCNRNERMLSSVA